MRHREPHFQGSTILRDWVIGMSDGLTVPFALAAGLSAASVTNSIILTAGTAELVAGAISMGLGGYLAGKTDVEHYQGELKREYQEIEEVPEEEKAEVRAVFAPYHLSLNTQNRIVAELSQNKKLWVDFMMRFELGMEEPDHKQAARSALNVGGAYALGGLVPLSGYFFSASPQMGIRISSVVTLLALGVFGFIKGRLTGQPPFKGAVKVMLVGACAALAAFFIAKFANF